MSKIKKARLGANVTDQKRAIIEERPDSFLTKSPTWSFSIMDRNHPRWCFTDNDILYSKLLCRLADFEGLTWQDIMSTKGSKADGHGSTSHFIPIDGIIREAQKRLEDIHQNDIGELFSLRLSGKERFWGILMDGVFRLIWYDRNHQIAKSER